MENDKFTQLVEDLKNGDLTLTHLQIAVRVYVRENNKIPDGVKDLLAGKNEQWGLIGKSFDIMNQTIGCMELAYRRGSAK